MHEYCPYDQVLAFKKYILKQNLNHTEASTTQQDDERPEARRALPLRPDDKHEHESQFLPSLVLLPV